MKILVASINFHPDHAGIANYSTDLAVYLTEQGHSVTVLTGFPYYPRWTKQPGDKWKLFAKENYRGVNILRGYLYVPATPSAWKRLIHEVTFCGFALLNGFKCTRPELVIAITPPLFLAMVARILAWRWRCPWITHIQDLPLDAARELGMLRAGLVMRGMLALERRLYQRSSSVVTLSHGMRDRILSKGVPAQKVGIVPNWINLELSGSLSPRGEWLNGHSIRRDRLIIAYAGNLGKKQGVDVLIDLADKLSGNDRFYFYIVGDGADRRRLEQVVREKKLSNLEFRPFLDAADYQGFLDLVDMVFVAQRSGVGNVFFPSKLLGIMAQRKPLLVSADLESELARAISSSGAGMVEPYGDAGALETTVKQLEADRPKLKTMGECGWRYVQQFERRHVLSNYEQMMSELVGAHSN